MVAFSVHQRTDRQSSAKAGSNVQSVLLDPLPVGLVFPAEWSSQVWYEPTGKRLAFRGFMSKSTFDRLSQLHSDPNYQRALAGLFQKCSSRAQQRPEPSRFAWLAAAIVTGLVALVGSAIWLRPT